MLAEVETNIDIKSRSNKLFPCSVSSFSLGLTVHKPQHVLNGFWAIDEKQKRLTKLFYYVHAVLLPAKIMAALLMISFEVC